MSTAERTKRSSDMVIPLNQRLALTVSEAAAITGFSPVFIRRHIVAGNLAAVAPGGDGRSTRLRPTDIDAWLQSSPWEPSAA